MPYQHPNLPASQDLALHDPLGALSQFFGSSSANLQAAIVEKILLASGRRGHPMSTADAQGWADQIMQSGYGAGLQSIWDTGVSGGGTGTVDEATITRALYGSGKQLGLLGLTDQASADRTQAAADRATAKAESAAAKAEAAQVKAQNAFDKKYSSEISAYRGYFGSMPDNATILDLAAHSRDAGELDQYLRAKPSHVPGMNIGQYFDLRSVADTASNSFYGHASNDQIIQDLFQKSYTSKEQVQAYYDQTEAHKAIPPMVYNAIYPSAKEESMAVWNQEPHPDHIMAMFTSAGSPAGNPQQANLGAQAAVTLQDSQAAKQAPAGGAAP